ncbi:MAG: tRNA (adenosine(37)-N6)-threonylcarbamoyltransferase complex ATPase subunit type 1 TsaE [Myxococcota bacterium]|jgi:tRNA threonylcarbamoyladenosine biosynthesis protein TsaE
MSKREARGVFGLRSTGREATFRLGSALGALSGAGTVIGLVGDLGSGKTVLVKGLALALGAPPDRVVSPTFTLVNEYAGRLPLYHFDLYRMGDESELDSIDYRRYLLGGVCAVEWFERFPDAWPETSVVVRFTYVSPRVREITVEGGNSVIRRLIATRGKQ